MQVKSEPSLNARSEGPLKQPTATALPPAGSEEDSLVATSEIEKASGADDIFCP